MIQLWGNERVVFSGPCRCIREGSGIRARELVLSPVNKVIRRFKRGQVRDPRQRLSPSPKLIFDHPFLQRRIQLDVSDISTTGFSVYENVGDGVLVQGMIIPEVVIEFAGTSRIRCSAQVIYRLEEDEKRFRYAFSIFDMDIDAYSGLNRILGSALDTHAHLSTELDMEDLWKFFFESDFIYPKKYRLVESYREDFKETYRKLYQENPEVARHFTYQENGRICAHVSMVRAYEKTWVVQHHISRIMDGKRAGPKVLKQILQFLNNMFRLPSVNAEHMMLYYRPENRFPSAAFGGFAEDLRDPKRCSVDLFSYFTYTTPSLGERLPEGWFLRGCSSFDIREFRRFYEHHSGGLLFDVLGFEQDESNGECVEALYKKLGLMRTWEMLALTHRGQLKAVFIVERSSRGLNLSDLLNCIKIVVTNPEGLSWNVLSTAIGQLVPLYETHRVPVLVYPITYVEAEGIPYEKQYQWWTCDACSIGHLIEFLERRLRISYWK
ncbi:MAG: hypothetical protein V2J25_03980 [Desulfatiglans sp.]|nr:hypothetical protein [Desulfatiglans sp.]